MRFRWIKNTAVKLGEEGKDLTLGHGGAEEEEAGEKVLIIPDPIVNMKPMSTSEPVVAQENSSTILCCRPAVLDTSCRRTWSQFSATLRMGVVNSGLISTARNVVMVTARRRARTWTRRVAGRNTTRRPNDAAMVDIHTILLTRCVVTAVLFPDLGLVYFSLDVSRSPKGLPDKNDVVLVGHSGV